MEQGAQLAELNGAGVWQHSNIYASGGRLVATYDAPSQPVPGYHYNLTDWLGTKRVQTTAGGGPQETCLSYPFGDGLACSGGTDATEQHFTGKDRDAESGLDYFYARYYNSNLGRFLTPDWAAKPAAVPYASYGDPQSLNLYAYVNNNPNTGIDVDGHVGNDGETFVSDDGPGGVDTMEEEEGMDTGISIDQVYSNGITMLARNYVASLLTPPTPSGDDNLNPQQKPAGAQQPNAPSNANCSGSNAQLVANASIAGLSQLNPTQDETNNITPRDGNFASVANPALINTNTWTNAATIHGTSLQSPTIPGQNIFVAKLYNDPNRGNIIAVVYPNGTIPHILGTIPFALHIGGVNVGAARAYLGCP